jgi:UMF1 family MFS transporter
MMRSRFSSDARRKRSIEFFGFFSTSSKFAGIAGPLLFGVVSQVTSGSRLGIVSLIVFFVVGGLLLTRVNVEEGVRAARASEAVG